jgi:uncharacterized protein YoxC
MPDLTTTNLLLGIMAVVSVIEGIALIVAVVRGQRLYRQLSDQIQTLEQRHLTPFTTRMMPLMDDVKVLTTRAAPLLDDAKTLMESMQHASERVEHSLSRMDEAVQGTIVTAEQAVDKLQGGMRKTAGTVVGVVRGVRTAIETFLADQPNGAKRRHAAQSEPPTPDEPLASRMPRSHVVYPETPRADDPGAPPAPTPSR